MLVNAKLNVKQKSNTMNKKMSLSVRQKGIKYQTERVTNMKLFLKILENKPKFSECENECLIECQMKVKLNLYQM